MTALDRTVGDILARNPQWPGEGVATPAKRVTPPRLDGQPEFPEPGIYFGMPDDAYHAVNAFSASLCKDMTVSPMIAWARSPLNPEREDSDSSFMLIGRAYHARICEGAAAFADRFAVALDKRDYPDALTTTDEIKSAIAKLGGKPVTKVVGSDDVSRAAKKDDWVAQLLALDPDAVVWDRVVADHAVAHEGKAMLPADVHKRIEIAARMIENDPELRRAFTGGYPEVSLFWFDEKTGAPCKARVDYLKLNAFVDLKSFSLKTERPVERAIDYEIASRKHYIPVVHYSDGIAAVKRLVRDHGGNVTFTPDDWHMDTVQLVRRWAKQWAAVADEPTPLYVYQATGIAPITRGRILHRGTVFSVTRMAVEAQRRRYVECVEAYGTDPWLDLAPIRQTTDESIPMFGTDFGDE